MNDATKALRLLLLKKLCGKERVLMALLEWVNGSPPSELERLGVTRHQIRGLRERLSQLVGGYRAAETIIRLYTPLILSLELKPIAIEKPGGLCRCLICGAEVNTFPEDHLLKSHRDVVTHFLRIVIRERRLRGRMCAPFEAEHMISGGDIHGQAEKNLFESSSR
ncbi:MAG: hypothetical protein QXP97_07660 [Desulfurococcus sp.]|uniref:hypothetical protein n=1 Tax=Desulfurococcus sp. TaxID=51678 RepID=UPI0031696CDA